LRHIKLSCSNRHTPLPGYVHQRTDLTPTWMHSDLLQGGFVDLGEFASAIASSSMNRSHRAMKLLARTTTRRTAASFMLAVWLFALASGFANACLLGAPGQSGYQPSSKSSHFTSHTAGTDHDSQQSAKAPCLKACDAGSQALQSSNGMDSVEPGFPPLAEVLWTGLAPLLACLRSGLDTPPSLSDPPERIIFSRWAL
jgi:hypothetical protein